MDPPINATMKQGLFMNTLATNMNQTSTGFAALQSTARDTMFNTVMKNTSSTVIERYDQNGNLVPHDLSANNWVNEQQVLPNTVYCASSRQSPTTDRKGLSSGGSAGLNVSIDQARPSIMSEALVTSNLMATRIPYRTSLGDHNQMKTQTQDELFHARAQKDVANYSVGQHTPMSPNARQSAALDKITLMTLKARGKLLPGQPTAK